MLSAVVLCVQTALVLATGQAWIYLLQFPVAKLSLALLFARSAPTEHPLVSRLAAEMVSLRHGGMNNPWLHRFLQGSPGCGQRRAGRWLRHPGRPSRH
jgi:hypothetical protein